MLTRILLIVVAYLLGAIPSGYLLVKYVFTSGEDVRRVGSGGTGATNVTRRAGLKAGLLTYLFDLAKGIAAVSITRGAAGDDFFWAGGAALAVIAGHIFPIFLKFRGGKGVAAGMGAFIVLVPYAVLEALAIWAVILYLTRYMSLGSIMAAGSVPLFTLINYGLLQNSPDLIPMMVTTVAGSALIIAKHHENIKRLIKGKESKFGERVGEPDPVSSDTRAVTGGQS